jgi:hypothetical protein
LVAKVEQSTRGDDASRSSVPCSDIAASDPPH